MITETLSGSPVTDESLDGVWLSDHAGVLVDLDVAVTG